MVYQTRSKTASREKQPSVEDLSGLGLDLEPVDAEVGAGDHLIQFDEA